MPQRHVEKVAVTVSSICHLALAVPSSQSHLCLIWKSTRGMALMSHHWPRSCKHHTASCLFYSRRCCPPESSLIWLGFPFTPQCSAMAGREQRAPREFHRNNSAQISKRAGDELCFFGHKKWVSAGDTRFHLLRRKALAYASSATSGEVTSSTSSYSNHIGSFNCVSSSTIW
jgi:hypothetical protein